MEYHLTTKTFSFSNLEQTQHLIKVTKPTSLQMGSSHGIFKVQTSLNLWFTPILEVFSIFGIRSTHASSIIIGLGFIEGSNIWGIMLALWRETIVNSRFHSWFFCSSIWLGLVSLEETNSLATKASLETWPAKECFNLKLFGTYNHEGIIKTKNAECLKSKLKIEEV